jgi:hypothetical protein
MRTRVFVGALVVLLVLAVSVLSAVPTRQAAVVRFLKPTIIAGAAVMGPVVFEHDDAKMARGEPCTTIYQYDAKREARGKVIVEFMCAPKFREVTKEFEARCIKAPAGPDRLLEYQFKGDNEAHGVPY